jgi:hypothetical protein
VVFLFWLSNHSSLSDAAENTRAFAPNESCRRCPRVICQRKNLLTSPVGDDRSSLGVLRRVEVTRLKLFFWRMESDVTEH